MHVCIIGLTFLVIVSMLHEATCKRQKRDSGVIILAAAADGELEKLGLGHLEVIGTRFIDEHHEIHDYPGDKQDDKHEVDSSEDDDDYHHAIYDHVHIDKDDYSDFGDDDKSSYGYDSSASEDFHLIDHHHS